jgi:hypothetical protein
VHTDTHSLRAELYISGWHKAERPANFCFGALASLGSGKGVQEGEASCCARTGVALRITSVLSQAQASEHRSESLVCNT